MRIFNIFPDPPSKKIPKMRNSPSPETNRELFEYEAFTPHDPPLIRRQTCAYLRVIGKQRTTQQDNEARQIVKKMFNNIKNKKL